MTDEEKKNNVENQMAQAEERLREEFKTQITQLVEKTEIESATDLSLSESQRLWVQSSLEEALRAEKILRDSKNKDEYVDFTEEDKKTLKPALELALKFKAQETQGSAIASHLQGTFYGEIQKRMKECNVKKYRGFCKLTGYSHTTVYRKVKIAQSYTRDDLEKYPGVDMKALYEVAANNSGKASEALASNHAALAEAGSDVHAVRKILDPTYNPEKKIIEPDGIAVSPDERLKATFFLLKSRIMIDSVSESDWANFQTWLMNQELWDRFRAWCNQKAKESEEQGGEEEQGEEGMETQLDSEDSEDGNGNGDDARTPEELYAACLAQWDDPKSVEDHGTIDIATEYGVNNLDEPGWLQGELFIKYSENGAERLFRKNIFSKEFPLTSGQVTERLEKIRQDYPQVTDVMFTDDEAQFVVGARILNGNPVIRWSSSANA